jgi:hypothetical protein
MAGTLITSTIQGTTLTDGTNSTSTTNCIQGSAKAWVNFNMANPPVINGTTFNVSSITRISTGQYTVNFTNAMPNANYCATYQNANSARYTWFDTFTTTSLNCYCFDTGYADVSLNCVAVFSS